MSRLETLVIGHSYGLMRFLPPLLSRAGFDVDVISASRLLRKTNYIRNIDYAENIDNLLIKVQKQYNEKYKLVVIGDDDTLKSIRESNISDNIKLMLLPVTSEKDYVHIYSKIGLSRILHKNEILTPEFRVAHNKIELITSTEEIGYPVMIKVDSSSGGGGVFTCNSENDVISISQRITSFPLLIQKRVPGDLLNFDGFYQGGKLVHCSYSIYKVTMPNFGPSLLRKYMQLSNVDQVVFEELQCLGRALGANGFVNISAILSSVDQKRYYVEADMRPTVWVDYSKYIGDDPALAIKTHFQNKEALSYPYRHNKNFPDNLLIPYIFRMSLLELMRNKYNVWKYTKGFSMSDIICNILIFYVLSVEGLIVKVLKPCFPEKIWGKLSTYYKKIISNV
jgi:hypothetical protein